MWGCGGDSAVQPHSMDRVRGGEEGRTQERTQERTRECCTYPSATYPVKSARWTHKPRNGLLGTLCGFRKVLRSRFRGFPYTAYTEKALLVGQQRAP